MKVTELIVENENGETATLDRKAYIAHIVEAHEVKAYTTENSSTEPADVVNYILKSLEKGADIDAEFASEHTELIQVVEGHFKATTGSKEDAKAKKEEEKAKKEEEKKAAAEAKEKEAALALETKKEFVTSVSEGATLAAAELKSEFEALKDGLPEGVELTSKGHGLGLVFGENVNKASIANTLGYFQQKSINSSFLINQLQFLIGDAISAAVAKGVFSTEKEAAAFIQETIASNFGKDYNASSLSQYKRMAERTPVEFRNPEVQPTAYLLVAGMAAPRKGDKETEEQFKKRLAGFKKDQSDLQKKLGSGEITKRGDLVKPVNEILIRHGLKEAPSNEPKVSVNENLLDYFHATLALESFVGIHDDQPDAALYQKGKDIFPVTREELQKIKDEAFANLLNVLYTNKKLGLEPADYIRGKIQKISQIEVGKSQEGKPMFEDKKTWVPVYPVPFFEVEEEATEEAPAETAE